ncbi:type III secretion system export apparatus subunit SctR [Aestuariispira insulae]|uniref:Type III secretion protein R n=1 Tax=Aestuariispira insulae TaxID=1461337 RepID=A0A3D9H476_9PROT|nr:type III secretion system export apparatus subunit SctR [Aestuariispira insulae]RED43736.1 type III secretion protein R [Aestuariispira insulae]
MEGHFDPVPILILLMMMGLVPFAIVMTTSFAKIVVVLFLFRQALGLQQAPPNMVLYGTALILTIFISAPLFKEIATTVASQNEAVTMDNLSGIQNSISLATEPIKGHLKHLVKESEFSFFSETAKKMWPADMAEATEADSLLLLVPAFMVSELTRAFEIGFMLYLPFIAIDLIVSNLLLAMGSMMVSPMMISLPLKLFLFVIVDGWNRLLHGLVLSYQ